MARWLFSTINFYLARRFLSWFAIIFTGLILIISLFEIMDLLRKILSRPDISLLVIVEILILKLPHHIVMFLPFFVLASVMMVLWRLNQNSEITILRSMGLSLPQMLSGILVTAGALGVFFVLLLNPVKAVMTSRLYDIEDKLFGANHGQVSLQDTGLWLKEGLNHKNRIIHSVHVKLNTLTFEGLSLYEFDENGHYQKRIMAESGTLRHGAFHLHQVEIYENDGRVENTPTLTLETGMTPQKIQDSNATPETMHILNIIRFIDELDVSGLSSVHYKMYIHKQFSKIALMLVMVLLGAAFCMNPTRTGKSSGKLIALGLLSGLGFHFFTDFVYALGLGGRLPALFAVWAPVLLGGVLSTTLLLHTQERR